MATTRPFAYNTGGAISGTTQVGSLAVGASALDYSVDPGGVKWWMGPNEELGYVIAHPVSSGNQPTPVPGASAYFGFNRTSDFTGTSFISLAEYVSRTFSTPQTFASAPAASSWLTSNGFWNSWGNINTDGLTLQLDASNSSSYSGSGTTWYDLVSPQENITLVGSPTYTSASTSYFTFNGSTQYGTGTGPVLTNTAYTKSVWFYLNSYVDNNLVSKENQNYMFFAGGNKLYSGHANWAGFPTNFPSTASFNLNQWYCATLTFNTTDGMKLYINGVLDSTYTAIKTAFVGDGSTNIAAYGTGNLLDGRIAKIYCYNRSLTADEVLQNYRADLGQFGTTTIQSFTSVGSTTWTAPANVTSVEYLVVGGGGGGGNGYDSGGGGGAGGGMVLSGTLSVTPGVSYSITVGFGGTGGADTRTNNNGTSGGNSIFHTVTALGGGYGGGSRTNNPGPAGTGQGLGGAAQVSTTSSGVGGNGGGGGNSGGGGGGAGGAGTNRVNAANAGTGGAGVSSTLSGASVTYGAGGNGGTANNGTINGANGGSNTGKGGGAGSSNGTDSSSGGNGGSGIVIIKYIAN